MAEVSFGEWLRRRRNAVGLTQEQLALQLNCSTSALRKFESELRHPSPEIVEQLAEIFNIPQEERKAFLRYARGDWQAISSGDQEEAPWKASTVSAEKQVKTATPRNNLRLQLTSFIGREEEQKEIADLIASHRPVTLTGAGGIGKTRFSLEVARGVLDTFPNGVWFVELAPLSDPALVPQAIVNTLGLLEQANRPPQTVLTDFLREKRSLLILDNCEHLIQACAQLAETLLQACPDLRILATSREALGIAGEWIHNVATLSIPDLQQSLTTASLTEYEAVQLFLDRAQTVVHDFMLRPENALAIAQICHHLDGIPLALELAAARLRGLSVEQIAARLDDRFHLLTSGARTVLPRHQTLQALIDWSHDLLTEPERILLRRLSIFAGGWTLEAAEAVCSGDGLAINQILDLLLHLVDKSLVSAETQDTETRYHMLETIRQYANEKLWQAGEGELMRQRHLAYFVDLAERAEPNLRAFGMIEWLDRLETEYDDIRVALDWSQESDVEAQLRLASALLWFWWIRGHRNEGINWLERALSIEAMERGQRTLGPERALIRAKALTVSGFLKDDVEELEESLILFKQHGQENKQGLAYAMLRLGGLRSAGDLVEEGLTLFREVGDRFGVTECMLELSFIAMGKCDYKQAEALLEENLALQKEIGDKDGIATSLRHLGLVTLAQGKYQRADELSMGHSDLYREVGNKVHLGYGLTFLGRLPLLLGEHRRAIAMYEEALALGQEVGDQGLVAYSLNYLGTLAWVQGDYARATQILEQSLDLYHETGHENLIARDLHVLGDIALSQGSYDHSAAWFKDELDIGRDGQPVVLSFALSGLGKVAWAQGDYDQALQRFEEGLSVSKELNFKPATFYALYGLGRVAQSQAKYAAARSLQQEAISLPHGTGYQFAADYWLDTLMAPATSFSLEALAAIASTQKQMERTANLFGAAEKALNLYFQMSARERAEHDQAVAAARAALGEEGFARAWEEGKAMTLEQAVAYALES